MRDFKEDDRPEYTPRTASLLLVEDNDVDAALIQRLIRKLDSKPTLVRARNGVEALTTILDDASGARPLERAVVTLIDINMPKMSGLELIAELNRREHRFPEGSVYILSTSSHPNDQEAALAYPCVKGYLVKPLNRDTLDRLLAEAAQR